MMTFHGKTYVSSMWKFVRCSFRFPASALSVPLVCKFSLPEIHEASIKDVHYKIELKPNDNLSSPSPDS